MPEKNKAIHKRPWSSWYTGVSWLWDKYQDRRKSKW